MGVFPGAREQIQIELSDESRTLEPELLREFLGFLRSQLRVVDIEEADILVPDMRILHFLEPQTQDSLRRERRADNGRQTETKEM